MKDPVQPNAANGAEAPPPPTFDAMPLSPDVRKAIDEMGYKHPTPVQRAVYDLAIRGSDLVVQARTGTGKTAAFGLPIVDQMVKRSTMKVQALILCPTRELALQVSRELEKIAQFRGTRIVAIYGGAPMGRQIEALEQGAQVVVGTPGRVLDHLRRKTLDPSNVRIFVLDEADEMLSMGFAKELHAIVETLPKERQGLFFSATIPPDIERMAQSQLKSPEFVTLSSDQVGALEIAHFVYVMRGGDKRQALVRILEVENPESAIIFCNTREETERLAEALQNKGFDAEWLNGDLPQSERERVMTATREGKLRFLVATDVAARGIDISHLTHVINFDFPESAEYYVHRTGRTGRAGRTGTAISIVSGKDIGSLYLMRLTYKIRPIEKQIPTEGELKTRAELDVVELFEDAFGSRPVHPDDLALARRLMTHFDAEKIIAGLLRDHLGARAGDPQTEAAEARRARNPPPIGEAESTTTEESVPRPPAREVRAERPRRERDRRDRGERGDRGDRGERDRAAPREAGGERRTRGGEGRRGVPHAQYANWEPPSEKDDDKPILAEAPPPPPPAPSAPSLPRFEERPATPEETLGAEYAQVYVNVGRREGARAADLQKLLEDGGIPRDETSRIRVRDRMTFVSVKKDLVERVIAALAGQVIGGRTVVAELARARGREGDERSPE